jgi:hypothetical protein
MLSADHELVTGILGDAASVGSQSSLADGHSERITHFELPQHGVLLGANGLTCASGQGDVFVDLDHD